ncbi:PREDICTED: 7SK snRNA methylphosphate capping enzyme isoform X2 [Elephantulus edwardii]|uniref:7SK snRNA methylphosphate capping enzyme isoform X2 n=1 Tax=Elephantulus edwardii TaxID=28737 RepID=UPI0003F0CCB8|nr:PREDICTED: 7SK snRNA methylphosphate capping enzyme isoform X2 [Elephantulus edwardii]
MIEMAAEKEPFLVPAPPPPLKNESSGGGGPTVQSHREAASGQHRGRTERGPGPRVHSTGAPQQRGGGPQAQSLGEARLSDPQGRAAPPEAGEERRGGGGTELCPPAPPRPRNGYQPHRPPGGGGGKRRNSCNVGGGGGGFKHPAFKRRRRVNSDCDSVLPSNFLLGGNIFDPLNLNSLLDEEVSRALNAETPKSSPLPAKGRDPVEILIPKDITDPLSLNTCTDEAHVVLASPLKVGRKRHRHRGQHHQQQQAAGGNDNNSSMLPPAPLTPSLHGEGATQHRGQNRDAPQPYELNTAINCRDEVVSPLPTVLQGSVGSLSVPSAASVTSAPSSSSSRHRKRRRTSSKSEARGGGQGLKEKGRGSGGGRHHHHPLPPAGFKKQQCKFQYGNYCKYYGYRNPSCEDGRLRVLKPEWFRGRDVLDLGCNVGHLTLSIACKWGPSRMVGLDIDARLIHSARQNIRHYLSEELRLPPQAPEGEPGAEVGEGTTTTTVRKRSCFPASLTATRGPIAAPQVPLDGADTSVFPNNVVFVTGNYVLDRDELVEAQTPEYDVVLCLSLTKWVHLNWGDEGLKRMFRRIYRHLRPGGILVLEPQPWSSYGKRKTLTETIYKNYYRIQLKPEQFASYLTSPEVGFSSYELVATPHNTSKGFQRPVYLFHKACSPSH